MASSWQPQEEPLKQLAQFLKDSLSGHDKNTQKTAELMLKNAKNSPDINNYLAFLFADTRAAEFLAFPSDSLYAARSAAAIMLKNDIKTSYKSIPDSNKAYIKDVILLGLQDPLAQIRGYAGNVITEIVKQGGILGWPQILSELIRVVSNEGGNVSTQAQEGAMGALLKICEDNKKAMDSDYQGQRPLDYLFPKFLEFTGSPLPKVRAYAIASMNVFIPEKPQAVALHVDAMLQRLFQLANDPSDDVRKHMCRSIIQIADISPERIAPHMEGLVDFMVVQQRSQEDPELALDAAEFWLCLGEDDKLRDGLGPHLPKIVPALLESMVYAEDDVLRLEADEEEDAEVEDRAEDIKPVFATNKGSRLQSTANGDSSTNGASKDPGAADVELSDGEIEEFDDEDSDFGDPEDQWNLRKCSAAALDVLASYFHGPVFEVTLPYLKDNLVHSEWPNREAAVLALGAIADGCMDVVQPHLPELTQYLLSLLKDKQPVVRQITCWSLGRYSGWAASLPKDAQQQYFVPIMEGLLNRMLDPNKRVQEAAASAFANLEERAGQTLCDYCEVIINQFDKCFDHYKDRNMFILYDCVQTLAEHIGPALQNEKYRSTLMNALIRRYDRVKDDSREIFPLLECLSYVATALKNNFGGYATPIFSRCIKIIHKNLQDEWTAANNGQTYDLPDKDFLVTALDLLSAVIQAVDPQSSAQLVAESQPNLFQLMAFCMKDNNNDVRQSAYALLGDCAIYVFEQLQQYLPQILETAVTQLEIAQIQTDAEATGYSVINNACWSIGEIAMRQKEGMAPYVPQLLPKLATILFNDKVPPSLNENAAIAIGRLGIGSAETLAPLLSQFCNPFVKIISNVDWTDEKGHALKGFINVVLRNPAAMESCLLPFFHEIASAPAMYLESDVQNENRRETFQKVFDVYKTMIPDFSSYLNNNLPAEQVQALQSRYQL